MGNLLILLIRFAYVPLVFIVVNNYEPSREDSRKGSASH